MNGFLSGLTVTFGYVEGDALTIGSYVVLAVAGLAVVGLALSMIRKI